MENQRPLLSNTYVIPAPIEGKDGKSVEYGFLCERGSGTNFNPIKGVKECTGKVLIFKWDLP